MASPYFLYGSPPTFENRDLRERAITIAMLESMFVTSVPSGSHPIAARPAPASIAASPVPPQYCASADQS